MHAKVKLERQRRTEPPVGLWRWHRHPAHPAAKATAPAAPGTTPHSCEWLRDPAGTGRRCTVRLSY